MHPATRWAHQEAHWITTAVDWGFQDASWADTEARCLPTEDGWKFTAACSAATEAHCLVGGWRLDRRGAGLEKLGVMLEKPSAKLKSQDDAI